MKEVICGYCKFFRGTKQELRGNHYYLTTGNCKLKDCEVDVEAKVCEEYIMMKGLYTNRIIPDYCKNYNQK